MADLKYTSRLNLGNFNNSHTLAYNFILDIGRGGLKILEVGCSAGYFGEALKAAGHHVVGVEPDENAARKAETILDEVYCGFVEDFFAANQGRTFDVITFGDVLEHLADPVAVLRMTRQFLAVDGRIVVSVPNVAHASVRAMLLGGDWDYADLGILDRTHLRFFTKRGLVALLKDAGFAVEYIQPVVLDVLLAARMCGMSLHPKLVKAVEQIDGDDTLHDFQYVISAKSGVNSASQINLLSRKRLLRIVVVSDKPTSTITDIRLGNPLRRLAWAGGRDITFCSFGDFSFTDLQGGDVFVMQRGCSPRAREIAELISASGKPFIYDIDDLLTKIPDFLGHHVYLSANKKNIEACMRMASVVTVTTERLAKALSVPEGKIAICPNYAKYTSAHGLPPAEQVDDGSVTLVIASSDKIIVDFLINPLKIIQGKYGDKVRVVCIGAISEKIQAAGIVGDFCGILSHDDFDAKIRSAKNPIGVIPLDDSEFSSCKSAVKYFDYTKAGCAVICSNVPPYSDVLEAGEDGLLVSNTDEAWVDGLCALIDSASCRRRLASSALARVEGRHTLNNAVSAWGAVFERLAPDDKVLKVRPSVAPVSIKGRLLWVKLRIRDLNRIRKIRRKQAKELKMSPQSGAE